MAAHPSKTPRTCKLLGLIGLKGEMSTQDPELAERVPGLGVALLGRAPAERARRGVARDMRFGEAAPRLGVGRPREGCRFVPFMENVRRKIIQ